MGKNAAKIILPVLAIGGLAAATGGFGLFGAGAAETGAATAATATQAGTAGMAAGVTDAAGLSIGGIMPGGQALAATPGLTPAMTNAAGLSVGGVMPGAATAAESSGLFSSLIGGAKSGALLSYGEAAGLGISGVSSAVNASSAMAQARTQQDALDLQRLSAELDATSREVDSQEALSRTLASQMVVLTAQGRDPGGPTAQRLLSATENAADRQLLSARAAGAAARAGYGLQSAQVRQSRNGAVAGSLLQLGASGWSIFNGQRKIG